MGKSVIPSSKTLTRRAQDLGKEVWIEYRDLRTKYRSQGLTPREACERACVEMELLRRWADWKMRANFRQASGSAVALTAAEIREVLPNYVESTETRAESVGSQELSFTEEILWARDQRAMVENGSPSPTHFPSKGALSWYQYALANREKFMQHVASVSKPTASGEDVYMRDSQYQFKEIESQISEALKESGIKLVELEDGFLEQWHELTQARD